MVAIGGQYLIVEIQGMQTDTTPVASETDRGHLQQL